MKPQAIFDTVVTHLMKQGEAAMGMTPNYNGDLTLGCAYRGQKKKSACAVGCLIPDNLYDPAFEGSDIKGIQLRIGKATHCSPQFEPEVADKARRLINKIGKENLDLLDRLQTVHDLAADRPWKRNKKNRCLLLLTLRNVAYDFKLKIQHLPAFEELTGVSKRAVS